MKNTKLIALVAVLLVVSVVVSVVISTSGNGKINDAIEAIKNETAGKLDELTNTINKQNGTINDLENKLDQAQKENEELKNEIQNNDGNVSAEDYDAATAALESQIEKLVKAIEDYEKELNEEYELVLDKSLYWDWNDSASELYENAYSALYRAVSVAQQDKIVADFTAAIRVIPTKVEELYALVASIEADGATADDKEAVEKIMEYDMFTAIDVTLFEGEDNTAKAKTKDALQKKYNNLLKDYKDAAKAHFVELVAELPDVDNVKITDEKAVSDVRDYKDHLDDLQVATTKGDARKAEKKLLELEARIPVLEQLKEDVKTLNETIKTAFDKKDFLLNKATLTIIENLEESIKTLFYGPITKPATADTDEERDATKGWEKLYDLDLDSTSSSCNTYVYNFVDVAAVEAYRAKFEGLKDDLKVAVEVFYDAVDGLEDLTTLADWKTAEATATEAYNAILAIVGAKQKNDVDTLLGNEADEDGKFEYAENFKKYTDFGKAYTAINTKINSITNYVTKTVRELVCTNDMHYPAGVTPVSGKSPCNCDRNDPNATFASTYSMSRVLANTAAFQGTLTTLKSLMATYEFTEEEILGDLLGEYHTLAVISLQTMAKKAVDAAVTANTTADADAKAFAKANCYTQIEAVNSITFSVEYDEERDLTDDDVQDPSAYVWTTATQTVFDALTGAVEAFDGYLN